MKLNFEQHRTPGVTEISVSPGNLPRSHLFSNPGIPYWTICVKETNLVPEPRRTICLMFDSRRESEADSCLISSEIVLLEPQTCRQYCLCCCTSRQTKLWSSRHYRNMTCRQTKERNFIFNFFRFFFFNFTKNLKYCNFLSRDSGCGQVFVS